MANFEHVAMVFALRKFNKIFDKDPPNGVEEAKYFLSQHYSVLFDIQALPCFRYSRDLKVYE